MTLPATRGAARAESDKPVSDETSTSPLARAAKSLAPYVLTAIASAFTGDAIRPPASTPDDVQTVRRELADVQHEVAGIRGDVRDIRAAVDSMAEVVERIDLNNPHTRATKRAGK